MCCGGVKRLSRQKRILLTDILVKIRDTLSGRKPSLQAGGCWAEDSSRQSEPGLEQQRRMGRKLRVGGSGLGSCFNLILSISDIKYYTVD